MLRIAIKMFVGYKEKFIGVVFGIFLTTLMITFLLGTLTGTIYRSFRIVTDIPLPDIWVISPDTQSLDDIRSISRQFVQRVRSVQGVEWATPLSRSLLTIITENGNFTPAEIYGIDDATLMGAPLQIIQGNVFDLHKAGSVIIDDYTIRTTLAHRLPSGETIPFKIGDRFEINKHHGVIVGIAKMTFGFFAWPIMVTSIKNLNVFSNEANYVDFILVKAAPGESIEEVCRKIEHATGLTALSKNGFIKRIVTYFAKQGFLANLVVIVFVGFIAGIAISGQMFYAMILENLPFFALFKAIGIENHTIYKMICVQVLLAGFTGYGLGLGMTLVMGFFLKGTFIAFLLPWQLALISGLAVLIICIFTAMLSVSKLMQLDPKTALVN